MWAGTCGGRNGVAFGLRCGNKTNGDGMMWNMVNKSVCNLACVYLMRIWMSKYVSFFVLYCGYARTRVHKTFSVSVCGFARHVVGKV